MRLRATLTLPVATNSPRHRFDRDGFGRIVPLAGFRSTHERRRSSFGRDPGARRRALGKERVRREAGRGASFMCVPRNRRVHR